MPNEVRAAIERALNKETIAPGFTVGEALSGLRNVLLSLANEDVVMEMMAQARWVASERMVHGVGHSTKAMRAAVLALAKECER